MDALVDVHVCDIWENEMTVKVMSADPRPLVRHRIIVRAPPDPYKYDKVLLPDEHTVVLRDLPVGSKVLLRVCGMFRTHAEGDQWSPWVDSHIQLAKPVVVTQIRVHKDRLEVEWDHSSQAFLEPTSRQVTVHYSPVSKYEVRILEKLRVTSAVVLERTLEAKPLPQTFVFDGLESYKVFRVKVRPLRQHQCAVWGRPSEELTCATLYPVVTEGVEIGQEHVRINIRRDVPQSLLAGAGAGHQQHQQHQHHPFLDTDSDIREIQTFISECHLKLSRPDGVVLHERSLYGVDPHKRNEVTFRGLECDSAYVMETHVVDTEGVPGETTRYLLRTSPPLTILRIKKLTCRLMEVSWIVDSKKRINLSNLPHDAVLSGQNQAVERYDLRLVNPLRGEVVRSKKADGQNWIRVEDLEPATPYTVQVRYVSSSGFSSDWCRSVVVTTLARMRPSVDSRGPNFLEIFWSRPVCPNILSADSAEEPDGSQDPSGKGKMVSLTHPRFHSRAIADPLVVVEDPRKVLVGIVEREAEELFTPHIAGARGEGDVKWGLQPAGELACGEVRSFDTPFGSTRFEGLVPDTEYRVSFNELNDEGVWYGRTSITVRTLEPGMAVLPSHGILKYESPCIDEGFHGSTGHPTDGLLVKSSGSSGTLSPTPAAKPAVGSGGGGGGGAATTTTPGAALPPASTSPPCVTTTPEIMIEASRPTPASPGGVGVPSSQPTSPLLVEGGGAPPRVVMDEDTEFRDLTTADRKLKGGGGTAAAAGGASGVPPHEEVGGNAAGLLQTPHHFASPEVKLEVEVVQVGETHALLSWELLSLRAGRHHGGAAAAAGTPAQLGGCPLSGGGSAINANTAFNGFNEYKIMLKRVPPSQGAGLEGPGAGTVVSDDEGHHTLQLFYLRCQGSHTRLMKLYPDSSYTVRMCFFCKGDSQWSDWCDVVAFCTAKHLEMLVHALHRDCCVVRWTREASRDAAADVARTSSQAAITAIKRYLLRINDLTDTSERQVSLDGRSHPFATYFNVSGIEGNAIHRIVVTSQYKNGSWGTSCEPVDVVYRILPFKVDSVGETNVSLSWAIPDYAIDPRMAKVVVSIWQVRDTSAPPGAQEVREDVEIPVSSESYRFQNLRPHTRYTLQVIYIAQILTVSPEAVAELRAMNRTTFGYYDRTIRTCEPLCLDLVTIGETACKVQWTRASTDDEDLPGDEARLLKGIVAKLAEASGANDIYHSITKPRPLICYEVHVTDCETRRKTSTTVSPATTASASKVLWKVGQLQPAKRYRIAVRRKLSCGAWGSFSNFVFLRTFDQLKMSVVSCGEDYLRVSWGRVADPSRRVVRQEADPAEDTLPIAQVEARRFSVSVTSQPIAPSKTATMKFPTCLSEVEKLTGKRAITLSNIGWGKKARSVYEEMANLSSGCETKTLETSESDIIVDHLTPNTVYSLSVRGVAFEQQWDMWSQRIRTQTLQAISATAYTRGEDLVGVEWVRPCTSKLIQQLRERGSQPCSTVSLAEAEAYLAGSLIATSSQAYGMPKEGHATGLRKSGRRKSETAATQICPATSDERGRLVIRGLPEASRLQVRVRILYGDEVWGHWSPLVDVDTLPRVGMSLQKIGDDFIAFQIRPPQPAFVVKDLAGEERVASVPIGASNGSRACSDSFLGGSVGESPTVHRRRSHCTGIVEVGKLRRPGLPDYADEQGRHIVPPEAADLSACPKLDIVLWTVSVTCADGGCVSPGQQEHTLTFPVGGKARRSDAPDAPPPAEGEGCGAEGGGGGGGALPDDIIKFTLNALTPNTLYRVRCKYLDATGAESPWCEPALVSTLPPVVLKVGDVAESFLHASWGRDAFDYVKNPKLRDARVTGNRGCDLQWELLVFDEQRQVQRHVLPGDASAMKVCDLQSNSRYALVIRAATVAPLPTGDCHRTSDALTALQKECGGALSTAPWGVWSPKIYVTTTQRLTQTLERVGQDYIVVKWAPTVVGCPGGRPDTPGSGEDVGRDRQRRHSATSTPQDGALSGRQESSAQLRASGREGKEVEDKSGGPTSGSVVLGRQANARHKMAQPPQVWKCAAVHHYELRVKCLATGQEQTVRVDHIPNQLTYFGKVTSLQVATKYETRVRACYTTAEAAPPQTPPHAAGDSHTPQGGEAPSKFDFGGFTPAVNSETAALLIVKTVHVGGSVATFSVSPGKWGSKTREQLTMDEAENAVGNEHRGPQSTGRAGQLAWGAGGSSDTAVECSGPPLQDTRSFDVSYNGVVLPEPLVVDLRNPDQASQISLSNLLVDTQYALKVCERQESKTPAAHYADWVDLYSFYTKPQAPVCGELNEWRQNVIGFTFGILAKNGTDFLMESSVPDEYMFCVEVMNKSDARHATKSEDKPTEQWHQLGMVKEGHIRTALDMPINECYFRVKAANHMVIDHNVSVPLWGDYSQVMHWKEPLRPTSVAAVRVANLKSHSAKVVWDKPSNSASQPGLGYMVLMAHTGDGGTRTWAHVGTANTNNYVIPNLSANTCYRVCIKTVSNFGTSPKSAVLTFTTNIDTGRADADDLDDSGPYGAPSAQPAKGTTRRAAPASPDAGGGGGGGSGAVKMIQQKQRQRQGGGGCGSSPAPKPSPSPLLRLRSPPPPTTRSVAISGGAASGARPKSATAAAATTAAPGGSVAQPSSAKGRGGGGGGGARSAPPAEPAPPAPAVGQGGAQGSDMPGPEGGGDPAHRQQQQHETAPLRTAELLASPVGGDPADVDSSSGGGGGSSSRSSSARGSLDLTEDGELPPAQRTPEQDLAQAHPSALEVAEAISSLAAQHGRAVGGGGSSSPNTAAPEGGGVKEEQHVAPPPACGAEPRPVSSGDRGGACGAQPPQEVQHPPAPGPPESMQALAREANQKRVAHLASATEPLPGKLPSNLIYYDDECGAIGPHRPPGIAPSGAVGPALKPKPRQTVVAFAPSGSGGKAAGGGGGNGVSAGPLESSAGRGGGGGGGVSRGRSLKPFNAGGKAPYSLLARRDIGSPPAGVAVRGGRQQQQRVVGGQKLAPLVSGGGGGAVAVLGSQGGGGGGMQQQYPSPSNGGLAIGSFPSSEPPRRGAEVESAPVRRVKPAPLRKASPNDVPPVRSAGWSA